MIDFHTHILPGIDDGSDNEETSIKILRLLKEQGVGTVLLTPHFYAYASMAESFRENKQLAAEKLVRALKNNPVDIDLYLGCEVLYFEELWRVDGLRDFCIAGTDYILVEMPFASWSDSMVRGVEKLIGKGLTPIIAHFERYIKYKGNMNKIYELVNLGALMQMNCSYINGFMTRRKAVSFIKSGMVFAIGTDCHNLEDRAPDYASAVKYLEKKLSDRQVKKLISGPKRILQDAVKIYSREK